MSLILDALRKAERERELGQTPTIGSQLPLRRRSSPARRGPWIAVLAVVALAVIAIAAWSQRAAWWPSVEPGADVAIAVAPAGPAQPAEAVAPASTAPIPAPALAADGTAAIPDTAPSPPVGDVAPEKLAAIEAAPATGAPDPIEEARRVAAEALAIAEAARRDAEKAKAAVAAPAPVAPAPIAIGEPVPPPPASSGAAPQASLEPDPTGVAPPPSVVEMQKPVPEPNEPSLPAVPMAWELPLPIRQSLPRLTIAMHVWNEEPTRRFVVVNDERLVEGESAAAGVAIAEIRREGVVFEYQGQRFLLPRGGP